MSVIKVVLAGIMLVAGLSSQAAMAKEWKEIRIATEGTYKPLATLPMAN